MDIIKFWKDQAEIWNDETKCGFCWSFGGALTESAIESYRIRNAEECCVHLFLTNINFNQFKEYNQSGLVVDDFCDYSFTLWALIPSSLGINNYNETDGHEIGESVWETIQRPLLDCLGCDDMQYICENLGYPVRIDRWQMDAVFKLTSNNYDGWRIEGTFRKLR